MSFENEEAPSAEMFLEGVDNEKQIRYDERISRELIKLFGFSTTTTQLLFGKSREGANVSAEGFTPEWVSWYLDCPVIFRAFKDYKVNNDVRFLNTEQMLWACSMGPKWDCLWTSLWRSTREEFVGEQHSVAVCFRPQWARGTMVVHNHQPMSDCDGLHGMYMAHRDELGVFYVQYLRDLVTALLCRWKPTLPG